MAQNPKPKSQREVFEELKGEPVPESEIARHSTSDDAWIVIYDQVFDVTNFRDHPGSHQVLLNNAGKNETDAFERAAHPRQALNWMKDFYVGKLQKEDTNPYSRYAVWGAFALAAGLIVTRRFQNKNQNNN